MKRRLFWKLFAILVAGTVALYGAIDWLANHTEQRMSLIAEKHQLEMKSWATEAEAIYKAGEMQLLDQWIEDLEMREDTWVAIAGSDLTLLAGNYMDDYYTGSLRLGRNVEYMIHLYYAYNPIMELPFVDGHTHFLVRLPQRMRPGGFLKPAQLLLQIALPFVVLALVCLMLYRHLVTPIQKLEKATRQFNEGNYDARVSQSLGARNDELASLARTFDTMAEHTGGLIVTQRQLIADLSHELRTPITRIEMALSSISEKNCPANIERIQREVAQMREMTEDALTLAWMDTEKPQIKGEYLDLVDLLDSIIDDARFEYPDRNLVSSMPESAPLDSSSHRILGQSIENVIRNALRYTPQGGEVSIQLSIQDDEYLLTIYDQGPGVPEESLEKIFQPFYRVEKSRGADSGGFGLGLALAKRQVEAVSGSIKASNLANGGLQIRITLPV
ncbi:histidine kinase sensor domain-containing protein [Neptuniibacter sp. SY11_33]|uniref:histidine kinase sensor domain-containing protein n=1 Tax=Neptuniibacter sp. SY11_33 TaxID=3398215 RepID=UPI0039F4932D